MQRTKRMKSICVVCKQVFEIGDNDKVFISVGDKTRTVCLPCQNKIRNKEVCDICGEPRNKKNVKTVRLVGYGTFQRICIWCIKQIRKKNNSRCNRCTVPLEVRCNTHCCERCTPEHSYSKNK